MVTGTLALRGVDLMLGVCEGGTENCRDLAVGDFRYVWDDFLLDCFVRELAVTGPPIKVVGRENMDALFSDDGFGFSSITSDFANRWHSNSISKVDVEGEPG